MDRISRFYSGKTILITGATGFLGQPLVEKILWVAPTVERIYLLIRPKKLIGGQTQSAQERLEKELFESSAFDRLRVRHGTEFESFLRSKLIPLPGDISSDRLGLDEGTFQRVCRQVSIVINSAAVVSFDAPLDEALELNVLGARRVAEFAVACQQAVLVHVSTAYVCGAAAADIPETLHHSADAASARGPFPPRQFLDIDREVDEIQGLIQSVRQRAHSSEIDRQFKRVLVMRNRKPQKGRKMTRRERVEGLRRRWTQNQLTRRGMDWARRRGWNDTYTYTKALGEQVVVRTAQGIPIVLLRPSIIESSLSEPSPGWLDGLRMADPLIVAIGKGRLRALPLNPDVVLDLVPVDMVVNAILAAIPAAQFDGGLRIYQVATGSTNPVRLKELNELIYRYFVRNPMLDKKGRPIRIRPLKFPNPAAFRFQHRLKAVPLKTAERTLEKLSIFDFSQKFRRKIAAANLAYQKLYYYGEIYEPYLNLDCRFQTEQALSLYSSLDPEERRRFNFDVTQLNWRHYIQNVHIPGVKKYILKVEGTGTLEIADEDSLRVSSSATINTLLAQSVARFSEKTALEIKRDGQWESLTYSELGRRVDEVAERLAAAGLRKGDRILLFSENQPQWGVAYLGAVALGLTVIPLDAQTWYREVWALAEFTEAKTLAASENCFKRLTPESLHENEARDCPILLLNVNQDCQGFEVKELPRSTRLPDGSNHPPEPVTSDDVASIVFTTGTSVDPRGAIHTHRNFLNNLLSVSHFLAAREDDRLLSVLPLNHVLEFTCGFLMPLSVGATVTYARSLKPKLLLETMRESGITVMLGVPTLYALIRDDIERRVLGVNKSRMRSNLTATSKQLSHSVERALGKNIGRQLFARVNQEFGARIRVLVSGGSALGGELYDDFKAIGMPLYEGYGLTETAPVLTVNPLNRSRRSSAGKPLPGVELRIYRPDQDGIGEIIVQSPSLMTRYFRNPSATDKVMKDGWFHTGDLGWVDEDGYLYITGRLKDVIITGAGKNVYPMDLEAIYQNQAGIREICVLGIKSGLTEDIHAVIVPRLESDEFNESQIRRPLQREIQKLASELPSYHRLQYIHLQAEALPRTPQGEVDREAVRRELQKRLVTTSENVVVRTATSHQQDLFSELGRLSGVPVAEIHEATHLYADLGLDSLNAIELLLFVEHHFGVTIADDEAESIQTVGQLLRCLDSPRAKPDSKKSAHLRSALPLSRRSSLDRFLLSLSFGGMRTLFHRYFGLELVNADSLPRNGPFILAANHSSHLDTGAVISALSQALGLEQAQKLHVLGARDYFFTNSAKRWFFSTFLNAVPIEREEASLAGLRLVKSILSEGEPVLIFPEGTRSRDGRLQEFKPGLGLLALELKVPIVPVCVSGTFEALPAGRYFPRKHPIQVTFGPPIAMEIYLRSVGAAPADETYRRIAEDVRRVIEGLADGRLAQT